MLGGNLAAVAGVKGRSCGQVPRPLGVSFPPGVGPSITGDLPHPLRELRVQSELLASFFSGPYKDRFLLLKSSFCPSLHYSIKK